MGYEVRFSKTFALEYQRFPDEDRDQVDDFIENYEVHGLSDFSKFEGKITPSWIGCANENDTAYATTNELWHYHIGLPSYKQNVNVPYKTSDWVVHFRWPGKGEVIVLVDMYSHYTYSGNFYLPPSSALPE